MVREYYFVSYLQKHNKNTEYKDEEWVWQSFKRVAYILYGIFLSKNYVQICNSKVSTVQYFQKCLLMT